MKEKEILQDMIIAHKFLLSMYNQFGLECSNKALRSLFNKQRDEISKHHFDIFCIMKDKDLYPVMEAEEQEVTNAVTMHTQMQQELNKL